uniref:Uncharacterized protein n=1 Tax=Globisporangium ultimum (strain ATCC 200006 / CBS 805.95 / DAOM BR144) TaxID=431595 RepID=K3X3D1_GLOUD
MALELDGDDHLASLVELLPEHPIALQGDDDVSSLLLAFDAEEAAVVAASPLLTEELNATELLGATEYESSHSSSDNGNNTAMGTFAGAGIATSSSSRKRRIAVTRATEPEGDGAPKSRRRSQWYALQKEEKAALLKELQYLEARVEFLRHLPENSTADRLAIQKMRENKILHNASRSQQFELAGMQSAIAGYTVTQQHGPFQRYIKLGTSVAERHATLASLKEQTLRDAERYIHERSRFIDVTQKYLTTDKFTMSNGDFCVSYFETMPFPGLSNVKQVFNALRFFFSNMDISLTESSGELVTREDGDVTRDQNVAHQRFLRMTSSGLYIESNQVMYSKYVSHEHEHGFGREYAVIAMDFVDDDEMYPYLTHERLRQDLTVALTVKTYPRKVSTVGDHTSANSSGDDEEQYDIVVCRSLFAKLHNSPLTVPPQVYNNVVWEAEMCSMEILRAVYDIVNKE